MSAVGGWLPKIGRLRLLAALSQTVAERPPGACRFPYSGLGKVCIQMPLQRSRDMPKFPKFVAAPCDATGTPGAITAIQ